MCKAESEAISLEWKEGAHDYKSADPSAVFRQEACWMLPVHTINDSAL